MTRPGTMVLQTARGGMVHLSCSTQQLRATYRGPREHAVYIALSRGESVSESNNTGIAGSSIIPYTQGFEGSTVFLPFPADTLYCASEEHCWRRSWSPLQWSGRTECPEFRADAVSTTQLDLTLTWPVSASQYSIAVYIKDLRENNGWGSLVGSCDPSLTPGWGDKVIEVYLNATLVDQEWQLHSASRFQAESRERIYELFVRLFGNTNSRRKRNGTLAENGCGKFADITDVAIQQIAGMGFTHIWLMGVLRHATTTSYGLPGLEADDTDLMKGLAGSPYAIKDCFDVAPDLAINPEHRNHEFRELIERIHIAGLKVLIDYVGNHVSRAYRSEIRPDLDFGRTDDRSCFFASQNNFFYLGASDQGGGPPLHLPTYNRETRQPISPTCAVKGDCDGLFAAEMNSGRVTGNNSITWTPSIHDWYETVKLNYGFEFTGRFNPQRAFPHASEVAASIPDTWLKMDAILAHWQALGVDGFRCDMAHMIPPEFWAWSIARARRCNPAVFFMAEAYNDYFTVRTTAPEVVALDDQPLFPGLLHAGFNAVYGHDAYRVIKDIYDGARWANDIDKVLGYDYVFHHSVLYAENHDEVRLASPNAWSGLGASVGRTASAVLFGLSRGPILFYNGQEVGEPAVEAEGFSDADGRTTLFDYWAMPELSKWVNGQEFDGGQLSEEQKELRRFYSRLIAICGSETFRRGQFMSLNGLNIENPEYGRLDGETASGHWLYAFLRYDPASSQRLFAVANLHESHDFTHVHVRLPEAALRFLSLKAEARLILSELLQDSAIQIEIESAGSGIRIEKLPALTPFYFALEEATILS